MKKQMLIIFLMTVTLTISRSNGQQSDWRNIDNAISEIPDENYSDQPYVVTAANGDWVCVLTTGPGKESQDGQHIIAVTSSDKGRTWSKPVDIEPSREAPLMASWVTPYITTYGRIYVFYNYNGDKVATKPHSSMLGWYCFRYSDDNGRTWSDRYRLPMRKIPTDYNNIWNGDVQLFWGISKPITVGTSMYLTFSRFGQYFGHTESLYFPSREVGRNYGEFGEGWLYRSNNINVEKDPGKLHWELLPEGDEGIVSNSIGLIQEEHNTVSLGGDHLFCIFRTIDGYVAHSFSRDGGKTWSVPVPTTYEPEGAQLIKNPRACPKLFAASNGKYLLWFHNNGGRDFSGRNPAWISGGVLKDGMIQWSQPEIFLYSPDSTINGMSYPDFIENDGKYWVTETQKSVARVHAVDLNLLEGAWNQHAASKISVNGLVLEASFLNAGKEQPLKRLPSLEQGGFAIDLWLEIKDLVPGQVIFDNLDAGGKGIKLSVSPKRTIQLSLSDGHITQVWDTDPGTVKTDRAQHIVFIVDGAPDIITSVVNGKFCDGGRHRQFGWTWFSRNLKDINGTGQLRINPGFKGSISSLRIYNRYLTTSEAVSHYRAGK